MTTNQLRYLEHVESKRHDLANEGLEQGKLNETVRHDITTEGETGRHNLVTEGLDRSKLGESKRHNLATEKVESAKVAETKRHDVATEGRIKYQNTADLYKAKQLQEQATTENKMRPIRQVSESMDIVTGSFKDIASGIGSVYSRSKSSKGTSSKFNTPKVVKPKKKK